MGPLLAEFRHQTAFYVARMAFCAAWTAFCVAQTAFRFHRQGRCFHALGSLKACSWHTDGILRGLGDILCGPDAFLSGRDGTKGPPELRQHGRGTVIFLFLASPNSTLYSLYQYNSTLYTTIRTTIFSTSIAPLASQPGGPEGAGGFRTLEQLSSTLHSIIQSSQSVHPKRFF